MFFFEANNEDDSDKNLNFIFSNFSVNHLYIEGYYGKIL